VLSSEKGGYVGVLRLCQRASLLTNPEPSAADLSLSSRFASLCIPVLGITAAGSSHARHRPAVLASAVVREAVVLSDISMHLGPITLWHILTSVWLCCSRLFRCHMQSHEQHEQPESPLSSPVPSPPSPSNGPCPPLAYPPIRVGRCLRQTINISQGLTDKHVTRSNPSGACGRTHDQVEVFTSPLTGKSYCRRDTIYSLPDNHKKVSGPRNCVDRCHIGDSDVAGSLEGLASSRV
jgi:hypothetical protein